MASATRAFTRAARATTLRTAPSRTTTSVPRHVFGRSSRRGYADEPTPTTGAFSNTLLFSVCGATAAAIGGFYIWQHNQTSSFDPAKKAEEAKKAVKSSVGKTAGSFTPDFNDYQEVYNAVAERLHDKDDYDDGSYGPVLLRLGWHASGTYDTETKTGGSNGATMRFAPEGDHGANAGLKAARDFLEPIKGEYSPYRFFTSILRCRC